MSQFFTRPLSFYKENEEEVLVLKRKLARPLLQTITPQNAQAIAEEFIELISKIHSSKLLHRKLKTIYDPIAEIERRFLNRFPGNGDNFKKAYEILLQKLRITKIVPSHCDAYPTNFLRNGNIILDLETMCFAPPSFDIETFLSVPEFQDIDKNQAKASYGRILPPEDECRFYELHNAFCQIGSFYSQGNPPLVEYFYNKAKTLLSGMRESILLSCLDRQIRDFL
jgi:thiamine kinase-like enzyme